MTPLCHGQTHVYRANAPRCDCGAQANNPPVSGYGYPTGYVPNPHHPRYVAPTVAPEIAASVKEAAKRCGASHLSADGDKAYMMRFGLFYYAEWGGVKVGSWFLEGESLPCGTVSVE